MLPDSEFVARDTASHPPPLTAAYRTSVLRSPRLPPWSLQTSLSGVTGPVFGQGELGPLDHDLVRNCAREGGEPIGERVILHGRVLDGDARPVPGALVEVWQANAAGRYARPADRQEGKAPDPHFRGWGRTGTDFETGLWAFETVMPGPAAGRVGHRPMAPHLNLWVAARGINLGLATRMYFGDEEAANPADPVLGMIEPPERRRTLIARREARDGRPVHLFDIRLQGEGETVFFDI